MVRHPKWHVITGAPCSGKTTLIKALEAEGYRVVHEVARAYMEEEVARGKTLAQMKSDLPAFEREILHRKISVESALSGEDLIFFDRALPDSIAYYRFCGMDATEAEAACRFIRYGKIFFLDRLAITPDNIRKEDPAEIVELERLLADCYRQLGYSLSRIPAMTVEDRLRRVVSQVDAP